MLHYWLGWNSADRVFCVGESVQRRWDIAGPAQCQRLRGPAVSGEAQVLALAGEVAGHPVLFGRFEVTVEQVKQIGCPARRESGL
ncbi:MAG: hypothetical protein DLM58_04260 [Pseudonocardiales bacterium]|nr:MAG: hypothetical protein DLM58_04260 [Pseudonocardiales bacterium]